MLIEVSDQNSGCVAPTRSVKLFCTITGPSRADSDILRQELQRVRAEKNAATAAQSACWRQQWLARFKIISILVCVSAARQFGQEVQDRTEVADAEATPRTQADMLHELFRIEHVAEPRISNQQVEILNQMNSLAENAIQGRRKMLMSGACAEVRHLDEITLSITSENCRARSELSR